MAGKVSIEITKGALTGKTFEYDEKTRIFIGRQEDCGIVMPESKVSRYHCVLEITPPEVKLQDFYSLNGTFLNGEKIGQRDCEQSFEQARNEQSESEAFLLHDGDVVGLSSQCELICHIEADETCAKCGAALPPGKVYEGTVPDGEEYQPIYYSKDSKRICEDCHLKAEKARIDKLIAERKKKEDANRIAAEAAQAAAQEAERKRIAAQKAEAKQREKQQQDALDKKRKQDEAKQKEKEKQLAEEKAKRDREAEQKRIEAQNAEEARKKAEQQRIAAEQLAAEMAAQIAAKPQPKQKKCAGCGKPFTPKADDNDLCEICLNDRAKVMDAILMALLQGVGEAQEKPAGPSPVQGYDKVSLLGEGGMGEVWKVKEKKTGKYFALKTMLPQVAADENAKKLFLREASVGKCLKHKNVVKTYQTGCTNGVFYILMDLCEGGSVDGLMEKHGGKLPLELATYIILQVLAGLDYVHNMDIDVEIKKGIFGGTKEVHAKGVVHRDFKPGNIFLSDKSDHPVAMVADFGMAKAFNTAGLSSVSKTGSIMGTPVFMPRQQAMSFKYAKPEVDVWAAAASYYNMLTGAFPKNFRQGKNPWQIIVGESAVPIRERDRNIPPKLAAVIDKALVEQPEIGCKTAAALRRDIIAALPDNVKAAVKGVLK